MKDRSSVLWRNEALPSIRKMAACLLAAILCVGLMPRTVYAEGAAGGADTTQAIESTTLAGTATLQIVHGLGGDGAPQVLVNKTYGFYEGATYADLLDAAVAAGDIDGYSLNAYKFLDSVTVNGVTVTAAADSSTYWSNYENGTYYSGTDTMETEPLVDGTKYQIAWNSYPTAVAPSDWNALDAADTGSTTAGSVGMMAGTATLQIVHGLDWQGSPQVLVNKTYGFYEGATYADLLDAAVAAGDIDDYSLNDYGFLDSVTVNGVTVAAATDSSTYWSNYENGAYYGGADNMKTELLVDGTNYQIAWNSYPTAVPPTDWSSLDAAGTSSTTAGDEPDDPSVTLDPVDRADLSTLFTTIASSYTGTATDWKAMDLAAAGRGSAADRDAIVANAIEAYKAPDSTNLQRSIIALTALGIDATDAEHGGATYDLVGKLATTGLAYDSIYGKAFALLAYECGSYEVPDGALKTKESLIDDIVASQAPDGGFAYSGTSSDADTTAMMIPALASSYDSDTTVKAAVDKALTALHGMEQTDGGFASTMGATGSNVASTAVVVIALCSLGLDPSVQWATASGDTPLSALMSFENASATGFTYGGAESDFATEQGFRALVAYQGFVNTGAAYNIYTQAKDGVAGLSMAPSDVIPADDSSATADTGSTLAQTGDIDADVAVAIAFGCCASALIAFAARRRMCLERSGETVSSETL